jgi:hypothetical protein
MAPNKEEREFVEDKVKIENAEILYRNFSGKPTQYNAAGGRRDFCVILPSDLARKLKAQKWNVKLTKKRDEDDEQRAYMNVEVKFDVKPPKITVVTKHGQTILDEPDVKMLDWAEIKSCDIVISPYNWEVGTNYGVKGYLKEMWVTIVEDEFADKYATP